MKKGTSLEKARIEGGLETIQRLKRLIDMEYGNLLDQQRTLIPLIFSSDHGCTTPKDIKDAKENG